MIAVFNSLTSAAFRTLPNEHWKNLYLPHSLNDCAELFVRYAGKSILVLEGGADVTPALYGQENTHSTCVADRDAREIFFFGMALRLKIPIFAICRGHQLVNVMMGGSLYQDLQLQYKGHHSNRHEIDISMADDRFKDMMAKTKLGANTVNSLHHQGIRQLSPAGRVYGVAPDGLVEMVKWQFGFSTQHHPEILGDHCFLQYMFEEFM